MCVGVGENPGGWVVILQKEEWGEILRFKLKSKDSTTTS